MAVLNPDASTGSKILFSLVKLVGEEENLEAKKILENRAHLGDKVNKRFYILYGRLLTKITRKILGTFACSIRPERCKLHFL